MLRSYLIAAYMLVLLVTVSKVSSAQAASTDIPVAIVNGEKVLYSEWVKRMEGLRLSDFVISITPLISKPQNGGQISLDSLINAKLVLQYAKKVSLMPTEKQVEADFEEAKARPEIKQALDSKKFTEAEIKDDIRLQRAFYNVATVNIRISKEETRAYFDRHPEIQGTPERWTLKAIRVTGKPLLDIVMKALASGLPFDKAATQYTEDVNSRLIGGDIGTINAADPNMPVSMKNALAGLKVGQVAPPVLLPGSTAAKQIFLIVKLTNRVEGVPVDFEKIKDKVEKTALLEKSNTGANKLAELRKDAAIEILLANYVDLLKSPVKPATGGKP